MNRLKPVFIDLADSDEDEILRNTRNQNYRNSSSNKHSGNKNDGIKRTDTKNQNDSDSDFCEIDEGRSAPRLNPNSGPRAFAMPWPAGSNVFFSAQPQMGQPSGRPPAAPSAIHLQPRPNPLGKLERLDHQRNSAQPSTRANSNMNSLSPRRSVRASPADTAHLNAPISKLQIAQKDYSHRQVDVRESRRCVNCVRDGRCCDGETPCAFCFDPGFACLYPREEPMVPSRKTTTSINEANRDNRMTSSDDWITKYNRKQSINAASGYQTAQSFSSKTSASPSSKASKDASKSASNPPMGAHPAAKNIPETEMQNSSNANTRESNLSEKDVLKDMHMDLDEQNDGEHSIADDNSVDSTRAEEVDVVELESIPATSWIPNSFEDVRKLIRTHEANIASHCEYVVEAQLANAKLTSKRNIHVSTEKRGANPFIAMVAAQSRPHLSEPPSTTLSMRVKARRSDYTNLKVSVHILGEDKAAHIPEYKSIGRLRSTFLARNVHGLKFVPYNSGIEEKDLDQRRKDLETRFKDHSSEEFRRQRECLESVYQWSDDFDEILRELRISQHSLWKWLLQSNLTSCQKCETTCAEPPTSALRGSEPSKAEKQRCQWLYEAMMKITQIGVWHFLTPKPGQIEKNPCHTLDEDEVVPKIESLLCSLCFTHNCLTHGSFIDEEVVVGEAVINDPEQQNNERQKAVLKFVEPIQSIHVCGLYCVLDWKASVGQEVRARDVLGLDDDGQLVGLRNKNVFMLTDLGPFRGNEPCTESCSLKRQNRADLDLSTMDVRGFLSIYPAVQGEQKNLMLSLSRIYSSHLRLPCMVSKMLDIDCCRAFALLLRQLNEMHSVVKADQTSSTTETMEARKISAKAAGYNTGRSSLLEHRMTWVPCSHKGPCLSTHSDCACAQDHVHCEKACGCADNCRRRFKGCRCKKICFLDDRCECYAANRECDPMLCHDCGVEEVLDPSNKYRDDVRNGRCRNNRLQLDLPPRTVKGMSEVQGWGLFLGEDLPANSFIGEYKGENISASESDRRGAIYAYVSQEYLFNLNIDNQLDGSRFGNKTRFINNSKAKEFINVFPKVMFVNGVTRIGLFTNRAIKAGEELLYDYGYPADLVQGEFWEKHERAIEHNGVVTPIAKPKFRPRMAKNAVDTPGQDEDEYEDGDYGDDEPIPQPKNGRSLLKGKRKRRMEEILADSEDDDNKPTRQASAQEATDSSDYEEDEGEEEASTEAGATSHESGVDEVDESEDELSIPTRRIFPTRIDRRRGGEAQRRAARTRKLNKMRGK